MAGHVGEDCFGVKLSLILGIMNSTDRREEKRNFLIQERRFRRSSKNYCNYRYFMKLSQLLSIVKLGIDVLLSEHLRSRCIDSSMYRYTPIVNTISATYEQHTMGRLGVTPSVKHKMAFLYSDCCIFYGMV